MKKQPRPLQPKSVPLGFYLRRLYDNPTFHYLKIEMEGNQYDVDVDDDPEYFEDRVMDTAGASRSDFHYIQAYNDGSVNTEITFTVPLTEMGVDTAVNMLSAFQSHIDNINNAGMHITLMGKNPYDVDGTEPLLSDDGLANLRREIQPILPFLQILGQSKDVHRGAHYCTNVVGEDKQGYPAVNVQEKKRIEFRFFHPCYDNPQLLHHYLEVLSNIVEYYEDPTKKVVLHGGTGVYRHLQGTSEFDNYAIHNTKILPETLAFSDIYGQFTGHYSDVWKQSTRFTPKSLPQQWAKKEYREALKSQRSTHALVKDKLPKEAVKWLIGDKSVVYNELNMKVLRGKI